MGCLLIYLRLKTKLFSKLLKFPFSSRFLFLYLKQWLCGQRFEDNEEYKTANKFSGGELLCRGIELD